MYCYGDGDDGDGDDDVDVVAVVGLENDLETITKAFGGFTFVFIKPCLNFFGKFFTMPNAMNIVHDANKQNCATKLSILLNIPEIRVVYS